jgi:hypothetical protein
METRVITKDGRVIGRPRLRILLQNDALHSSAFLMLPGSLTESAEAPAQLLIGAIHFSLVRNYGGWQCLSMHVQL